MSTPCTGSPDITTLDSKIVANLCDGNFYIDTSPSVYIATGYNDVQGAAVVGQKMFMLPYIDGGTEIEFLYTQAHTQPTLSRMIVI